jgi:hypothetical protein
MSANTLARNRGVFETRDRPLFFLKLSSSQYFISICRSLLFEAFFRAGFQAGDVLNMEASFASGKVFFEQSRGVAIFSTKVVLFAIVSY